MTALFRFLALVLQLVPPLLWWVLGGVVFCLLNLALQQEIWPNTPAAPIFFGVSFIGCLLLLPWLAARTAWHLSEAVESYFWKALWRLAAIGGYCAAVVSTILGLLAAVFNA